MVHYYEIYNPQTETYEYFRNNKTGFEANRPYMYAAKRVWLEHKDGRVEYVKLRSIWLSDMSQVDQKEFMWVKLRSQEIIEL